MVTHAKKNMYGSQATVIAESLRCRAIQVLSKQTLPSDIHAKHIVDSKHTEYCLVVCNGTKKYVNHSWANVLNFLEMKKIRLNIFHFPMWQACNQLEN